MAFWWTFVHSKCLVTLFDRKLQVFKSSPKLTIFDKINELLSTQNVSRARYARNVEWDFFCDFQTPCIQEIVAKAYPTQFFRRFAPKCSGCYQSFRPSDLIRKALHHFFHVDCFKCFICQRQLATGDQLFIINEDSLVCKKDYYASSSGLTHC